MSRLDTSGSVGTGRSDFLGSRQYRRYVIFERIPSGTCYIYFPSSPWMRAWNVAAYKFGGVQCQ